MTATENNNKRNRLFISRTEGEWKALDRKLKKMGKGGIHQYLHAGIYKLTNLYRECGECVSPANGNMVKKRHEIPPEIVEQLTELSKRMKRPISSIIDDFLLTPLLLPDRDSAV